MNWLTPLCQEIVRDKRFSREQRDTAVLWAGELSALCDRWVDGAPIPFVDIEPDDEGNVMMLSWLWRQEQKSFSLCIEVDLSVSLMMVDRERSLHEVATHELLKRSVQCFFEGWVPIG